jgi:iron-sulfur cluster assembly protein
MIQVTEKAAQQIKALIVKEGLEGQALRVAVIGGGCSGMSYKMNFDTEVGEDDKVYEDKGVRIVVDKKSLVVLNGTTLDFTDGLNGTGFTFTNPNAKSTCGCGSSFSS